MTVDTLSLARELKAAEVPPIQAEAIAAAIGRSAADNLNAAATKADLLQMETGLVARVDARLEHLRANLMMWFIGTNLTMAAVIIAAVKL